MRVAIKTTMKGTWILHLARTQQYSIIVETELDKEDNTDHLEIIIHAQVLTTINKHAQWIPVQYDLNKAKKHLDVPLLLFKCARENFVLSHHDNASGSTVLRVLPPTEKAKMTIMPNITKTRLKYVDNDSSSKSPIFRLCFSVFRNGIFDESCIIPNFIFAQSVRGKTRDNASEVEYNLQKFWNISTGTSREMIEQQLNSLGLPTILNENENLVRMINNLVPTVPPFSSEKRCRPANQIVNDVERPKKRSRIVESSSHYETRSRLETSSSQFVESFLEKETLIEQTAITI
jgi:hypothetical protein